MSTMWGHVLPSLLQSQPALTEAGQPTPGEGTKRKPPNQGVRPTGKGGGKARSRQKGGGWESTPNRSMHNQQNNQELLEMAIKLLLRHEAFLSRLQMDMVYIFTFKNQPNAPDSLLPTLYQVSLDWRNKYQADPSKLERSLRVTILLCLLTELLQRVRRFAAEGAAEAVKAVQHAGWMTSDAKWVYQVWSHAENKLQTDETRGTMSIPEAIDLLQGMLSLLAQPEILLKFAATRPLAQEMSGHQISFICEVSLRHSAADQLYAQMGKLMGHAMLHLVGLRIRPSRGRISELATHIQEKLYNRYCA